MGKWISFSFFTIILLFETISCNIDNSGTHENTELKPKLDSSGNLLNVNPFKLYENLGYILPCDLIIYNTSCQETSKLKITTLTQVKIIERTSELISPSQDGDICKGAYFVKILFNRDTLVCWGSQIYEKMSQSNFSFKNSKSEEQFLYPIRNMKIGVDNEDGLTECNQQNIYYAIENVVQSSISLIGFPINDSIVWGSDLKQYALMQDNDGRGDSIYQVSIKDDSLILYIKVMYQESAANFQLVTHLNNLKHSYIRNHIRREELDYMEWYNKLRK